MNSSNDNTYSKADRFAKLSEKLSQIHVKNNLNPNLKLFLSLKHLQNLKFKLIK